MPTPHSSVLYVEPNSMVYDWSKASKDGYDVAPRLEDYCIAMNIEVEVCSRLNSGTDSKNSVMILSWDSQKGKEDTISFMSGTKIGGWKYDSDGLARSGRLENQNKSGKNIYNALTTYYADMYVGDLVDYGTTEMLGIKSVDIKYQKSCVPIITVKFTDVRGISLFQPTELSRDKSYNGIKGLDKTNVAQSFFQCFFRMPMPKFTIYIKGFYGRPVSYEVMCDTFQTDLNSDTGDYDITARFIGYSYSFMTDVSLDALLVAPYSDYKGKQYWEDKVNDGTFTVWDKTHTYLMKMPTLYEIKSNIDEMTIVSNREMEKTTITAEYESHEEEIEKLKLIRSKYEEWYNQLYVLLQEKYGRRYCFLFKENGDDGDYYRIIALVNSSKKDINNLGEEYEQFSSNFKKTNEDLYSLITEYNNSEYSYKKLDNVSLDFSDYKKQSIFNNCYYSIEEKKVMFYGFDDKCKISRRELMSTMFNDKDKSDYIANVIFNGDGTDQYTDGFVVELKYSDIKTRLNALIKESSKASEDKLSKTAIKEYNNLMLGKMNWYPTVENFTRIMLAHFETLIHMIYEVKKDIGNRTAEELGITIGEVGIADVNKDEKYIPPFPRVTRNYIDDNGNSKIEDDWVGNLTNGEGFKEVDLIEGLFNAVETVQGLNNLDNAVIDSINRQSNEAEVLIKTPLTPFDFFLTKTPYGTDSDIINDPNAFAAKVCMRMYAILGLNTFAQQYGSNWNYSNSTFLTSIAKSEASNFFNNVTITNRRLLEMLIGFDDFSALNANNIIELMTTNKSIDGNDPLWGDKKLFDENMNLVGYKANGISIYPIQDVSFPSLAETFDAFEKSTIQVENSDIIINKLNTKTDYKKLIDSTNDSAFNTLYIEEEIDTIKNKLDTSMSSGNDDYKPIYDILVNDSLFNDEEYASFINYDGRTSFKEKIGYDPKSNNENQFDHFDYNEDDLKIGDDSYSISYISLTNYASECKNGSTSTFVLTEAFGFKKTENELYEIDKNSSLFNETLFNTIGSDKNKMAFFAMLLDCINYEAVYDTFLNKKRTFAYMPKLVVLQMGAILLRLNGNLDEKLDVNKVRMSLPLPNNIEKMIDYLNSISPMAKIAYIKYFNNWVDYNSSNVHKLAHNITVDFYSGKYYTGSDSDSSARYLFNESSVCVTELTNDLMKPIVVVSSNVFTNGGNENQINKGYAETYLNAFLEKLKELYNLVPKENGDGNVTRLTKTSNNTSIDMKKELYRYLKQLYDKWIASNEEKEWEMETFFQYTEKSKGHLFHFIDSFYNKIGDKLLINPMTLAEKIRAAFDNSNVDVSVMMLGFMADIYAKNKCMLLSLQNFMDMGNKDEMNDMFKPIPFNEMAKPNQHPDFVVLYPYEPSKNANIDNAEYTDDGFMLNDEYETPIAIRSRGADETKYYKIPAFGVTYGKQYQSYFKKINVNTTSPIATQQSIQMKHAILSQASNGKKKGVIGQDIYDIYSNQSFNCTVEMMGCAWVQPLMYFSLLNLPMFRGSYMIFEVNHHLVPGDMTTSFRGARMGKFATSLVEDIFTDDTDIFSKNQYYQESQESLYADVDNDCPYKVYPLRETSDLEPLDEKTIQKGRDLMNKVINIIYGVNTADTTNISEKHKIAAAGIVGNMYIESTLNYLACTRTTDSDGFIAAGLCGWNDRYYNLTNLIENNTTNYGQLKRTSNVLKRDEVIKRLSEKENGEDYQIMFLGKTMNIMGKNLKENLSSCTTAYDAAIMFENVYERSNKSKNYQRGKRAQEFYDRYDTTSSISNTSADDSELNNRDIENLFLRALNRSCDSTRAVKCNVVRGSVFSIKNGNKFEDVLQIKQDNGNTDYLANIFDMIIDGYYNHVQTIWCCYPNDTSDEPNSIFVKVSMEVKENRKIYFCKYDNKGIYAPIKDIGDKLNNKLLTILAKKYYNKLGEKYFNSEVPQLNGNYSILSGSSITSCASAIGGSDAEFYSTEPVRESDEIIIYDWNVENAVKWIKYYARDNYEDGCKELDSPKNKKGLCKSVCATYVLSAIAAGYGVSNPTENRIHCGTYPRSKPQGAATNLRYGGILEENGFAEIESGIISPNGDAKSTLQSGDIAIIGAKYDGDFHACMYTSNGWYSDFRQSHMNPYNKTMPYAIYRYVGKK